MACAGIYLGGCCGDTPVQPGSVRFFGGVFGYSRCADAGLSPALGPFAIYRDFYHRLTTRVNWISGGTPFEHERWVIQRANVIRPCDINGRSATTFERFPADPNDPALIESQRVESFCPGSAGVWETLVDTCQDTIKTLVQRRTCFGDSASPIVITTSVHEEVSARIDVGPIFDPVHVLMNPRDCGQSGAWAFNGDCAIIRATAGGGIPPGFLASTIAYNISTHGLGNQQLHLLKTCLNRARPYCLQTRQTFPDGTVIKQCQPRLAPAGQSDNLIIGPGNGGSYTDLLSACPGDCNTAP